MDCTYSYFAPDPENAKNRSDPGSSIDSGRDTLQSASEKSGEKDPPCDIKDAVRLLIPYPSDYSFPSGHTAVSFAAASALYFAGEKYLWKAALVFGSLHRIFQNVFVCTLSNGYSGWSASGNPVRISRMSDRRKQNNIKGRYKAMSYQFWGWEHADAPAITEEYPGIHNPRQLYDALSKLWCADTCAPRMRKDWTKENPTLGHVPLPLFLPGYFWRKGIRSFAPRRELSLL